MELIEIEFEQQVVIIQVNENLMWSNLFMMGDKVFPIVRNPTYKGAVIDLEHAKYIDSAALGLFLEVYKILHNSGRTLALFNVRSSVMQNLKVMALDQFFNIVTTREQAFELVLSNQENKP